MICLFLTVLVAVGAACMFTVFGRMRGVTVGRVCMVRGLFMMTGLVMLGCFSMMLCSMLVMFRCLLVMVGGFARHVVGSLMIVSSPARQTCATNTNLE